MKPYKKEKTNNKVREAVRYANNWLIRHPDIRRKYLTEDEFTIDMMNLCDITYNMARRVAWIIRADAYRDAEALRTWGFNQHTA